MSDQESSKLKIHSQQQKIAQLNQVLNFLTKQKQFKQQVIQQIKLLKENVQINQNKTTTKNIFNNVNSKFQQFQQEINQSKQHIKVNDKKQENKSNKVSQNIEQNKCKQSNHLKQVFAQGSKKQNIQKLKIKRDALYEKISQTLSNQEPYIWQKILQKINKLAKYKSKIALNNEINKKIKVNEDWIKKETLKLQNNLIQKQIQQNCVSNLGLMKAIMNKKVNINDYIYENLQEKENQKYSAKITLKKIQEKYQQQKKMYQENRILGK